MDDPASCIDATTQTDTESESKPPSTVSETGSCTEDSTGDITETPWYMHTRYARYWKHHSTVTEWYDTARRSHRLSVYKQYYQDMASYHLNMAESMKKMASYYTNWHNVWNRQRHTGNPGLGNPRLGNPAHFIPQHIRIHPHGTQSPARKRKGSRNKSKSKKRKHGTNRRPSVTKEIPPDEQFEMEITEDMMDFFVKSAEHRKQRDAVKKKRAEELAPEDDHIDVALLNSGKNRATVLPPSERPGARRTAEMKMLYGGGAAMIHGMETAMQLNYDRNCDLQQPKLWPHLPIHIKFS